MERAYALLDQIQNAYQTILGDNLTGVYIHGSLAFGCFRWDCSDIDFLVVTESEPDLPQKEALIHTLLKLNPAAPQKGFEMSVVLKENCQHFQHPLPYCLHFSNRYIEKAAADLAAYCQTMSGRDPDLAAHITVLHAVGQVLCGPAIEDVFAPVPPAAYLNSLWADVENAENDIFDHPVYTILNLCRVLAYVRGGRILSKEQGGTWGLSHLPDHLRHVVRQARNMYVRGTAEDFDPDELSKFTQVLLHKLIWR